MLSSVKKKLQQNINKILQLFMHTYKNKWQHFDHVFFRNKKRLLWVAKQDSQED